MIGCAVTAKAVDAKMKKDSSGPERREAEKYTGSGHPVFARQLPVTDYRAREG